MDWRNFVLMCCLEDLFLQQITWDVMNSAVVNYFLSSVIPPTCATLWICYICERDTLHPAVLLVSYLITQQKDTGVFLLCFVCWFFIFFLSLLYISSLPGSELIAWIGLRRFTFAGNYSFFKMSYNFMIRNYSAWVKVHVHTLSGTCSLRHHSSLSAVGSLPLPRTRHLLALLWKATLFEDRGAVLN